jgi:hypothetical protein
MFKYYTGNMAIIIDQYGPIFMIYHNMCDGCMDRRMRLKSIVGHTPEHKSWYTFLCTENTQAIDFFLENYGLYKQSIYVAQNIYWTGDGWNYMCNSILPNHTRVTWKQELYFSYVLCGLLIICKNTLRVEQDYAPCITNPIFFYHLKIYWKVTSFSFQELIL